MKMVRHGWTTGLLLLALIAGVAGASLPLGGCAPGGAPDNEVNAMPREIPPIDLSQPAEFATATFALG